MDQLFDLLPLIIGIIWFLSRGRRKKQDETTRESTEPQQESGKSLRDILQELEREFSNEKEEEKEVVIREEPQRPPLKAQPPESEESIFSYDTEVQEELKRQAEMIKKAEQDRDHHAFRKKEKRSTTVDTSEQQQEEERIFNLRQAVIFDAIMRRPDF